MRKKTLLAALMTLMSFSVSVADTVEPVDYVSTLVGTESKFSLSTGNTYPAIAMPWGMNFWMPQTGKMGDGWAYVYTADKIRGFKQTHQPSPWINDYGQFSIMPVTGKPVFDENQRASWFSHKAETAKPYYYKVYLADYDVTAEMAPTERAVSMRFTFPETDKSYIVVDAFDNGSYVNIIPSENMIVGYTTKNSGGVPANFKNYFVLKFDKPFTFTATVSDSVLNEGKTESRSKHSGAIVGFKTRRGEQVNVQVASSFISPGQALLNLKELGGNTLEQVVPDGMKCLAKLRSAARMSTICVRSTLACTVRCSFPAASSRRMKAATSSITARTMVRFCQVTCSPTPVSGTHSAVYSLCSIWYILQRTPRCRKVSSTPTRRAASCQSGPAPAIAAAW